MSYWAQKIFTKKGFVKENILDGKKALDVGCGPRKLSGAVGMDIRAGNDVDIVHDANVYPWPFDHETFDLVFFNQSLEHLNNVSRALDEALRVLKKNGRILIQVPYFRSIDAYADVTHMHFFTSRALDYIPDPRFKILGFWYGWPQDSKNYLRQLFKNFIQRFPDFYDKYLSRLIAVECLTWELEKRR